MLITNKEELKKYSDEYRLWQGVPKIEIFPNGIIFVAFTSGGIRDGLGNYVSLYRSDNQGLSFSLIAVIKDEDGFAHDAVLWKDNKNRLCFMYAKASAFMVYSVTVSNPTDDINKLIFSEEKEIAVGVAFHKPLTLKDGTTLLATWVDDNRLYLGFRPRQHKNYQGTLVSIYKPREHKFELIGKADISHRHFDSPALFQRSNSVLSMYVRTHYGIGKSDSYDNGKTWTKGIDSNIVGPDSTFYIGKDNNGHTLLINYDNKISRKNLYAYLSFDEGVTFPHKILLDSRDHISCPDVSYDEDGNIYIVYDRERGSFCKNIQHALSKAREILLAKIRIEDIIAGKIINKNSYLRKIIFKLHDYKGNDFEIYGQQKEINEYLIELAAFNDNNIILERIFADFSGGCSTQNKDEIVELNTLIAKFENYEYKDNVEKIFLMNRILNIVSQFYGEKNKSTAADEIVSNIITFVTENISNYELSVDMIAEYFHYSRFYLTHLFKNYSGISLKEYITNKRLSIIKELLITTSLKFNEIADKVGFLNSVYLSKWFKDNVGESMTFYRNTNKK